MQGGITFSHTSASASLSNYLFSSDQFSSLVRSFSNLSEKYFLIATKKDHLYLS